MTCHYGTWPTNHRCGGCETKSHIDYNNKVRKSDCALGGTTCCKAFVDKLDIGGNNAPMDIEGIIVWWSVGNVVSWETCGDRSETWQETWGVEKRVAVWNAGNVVNTEDIPANIWSIREIKNIAQHADTTNKQTLSFANVAKSSAKYLVTEIVNVR